MAAGAAGARPASWCGSPTSFEAGAPPAPPVAAFKAWLARKRADWAPARSPSPQHVHAGAPHLNTRTLPTWMGCPPGTLICNIPSMRRPTQQNSCEDPVRSVRGAKFFVRHKGRLRLREKRDSAASCGKQSPSLAPCSLTALQAGPSAPASARPVLSFVGRADFPQDCP